MLQRAYSYVKNSYFILSFESEQLDYIYMNTATQLHDYSQCIPLSVCRFTYPIIIANKKKIHCIMLLLQ